MYYAFSGVIWLQQAVSHNNYLTIFVILALVEVFFMILPAQIFDKFVTSVFFPLRMQLETAHLT